MDKKRAVLGAVSSLLIVFGIGAAIKMDHGAIEVESSADATRPLNLIPAPEVSLSDIPEGWVPRGILSDGYERAYARLLTMTPEERVGQLFLIRCPQDAQEEIIRRYHPGGFVLFREDFALKSKEQVQESIRSYQAASALPMLMAVDEEGGTVVRISRNPLLSSQKFSSPQTLYSKGGLAAVEEDTRKKAALLLELGLNLNLAPVADVSTDSGDYIYQRTLGKPADQTAEYVAGVVKASQESGMCSTLKHFPGYGNNQNTHTGISLDERPYEAFVKSDFVPFSAGIKAGAETVLISHNIVASMDAKMPASLSKPVHDILRSELGFTGVIMTDDLYMDAIRVYGNEKEPAVTAILAGNDLLISTEYERQIAAVLQAVKDGTIPQATVDEAAFRVLALKYHLALLEE